MSIERIPRDRTKLLLTLSYHGGFCTCQAMWEDVEIERLLNKGKCALVMKAGEIKIYVRRTENSERINREKTQKICDRWIKGNYVKVESALLPGFPQKDWMS